MENVKDITIDFNDLIESKKRLDDLDLKSKKGLGNMPGAYYTEHLLARRDAAYYAFLMAGRMYYNRPSLDINELEKLFEEEKKYHESAGKSVAGLIAKPYHLDISTGYDDEIYFSESDEEKEVEVYDENAPVVYGALEESWQEEKGYNI